MPSANAQSQAGESDGVVKEIKKVHQAIGRTLISNFRQTAFSWASVREAIIKVGPLSAGCFAPLAALYDIASLGESWYATGNGINLPDAPGNKALSAVGAASDILALGLLVLRFNSRNSRWKASIEASTGFYILKVILGTVNLCIYGTFRKGSPYQRNSSFWCAVVSTVLAAFIATTLLLYTIAAKRQKRVDNEETRVQGRHFMLGELGLFCIIALEALIFSKVEGWPFFQGIYFALVAALTVGFGDFVPMHTSTKVLLFPFTLLEIAFLASQISLIVAFLKDGSLSRQVHWRQVYEKEREQEGSKGIDNDNKIIDEILFLKRLVAHEDRLARIFDLAVSLVAFLTFWFGGSAVYWAIEQWTFGDCVYFSYVTFLSVGFGDFHPTTAAGRVFFVIWAILAVPLIASFAIQTVTSLWTSVQQDILEKSKIQRGVEPGFDETTTITVAESGGNVDVHPFVSHSDLVTICHKSKRQRRASQVISESVDASVDERHPVDTSVAGKLAAVDLLADEVLEQALLLEAYARRIMLDKFERGSKPRLLLQADQNLQRRAIDQLAKETEKSGYACRQLPDGPSSELEDVQSVLLSCLQSRHLHAKHQQCRPPFTACIGKPSHVYFGLAPGSNAWKVKLRWYSKDAPVKHMMQMALPFSPPRRKLQDQKTVRLLHVTVNVAAEKRKEK